MKNIKNIIKLFAAALCIMLVSVSCANQIENKVSDKVAYLQLNAISGERSTLFPVYDVDDFTEYTLTGIFQGHNSTEYDEYGNSSTVEYPVELGSWNSYTDFRRSCIAIPYINESYTDSNQQAWDWTFILDAYTDEGAYFSATINKKIVMGPNSISFPLKAKEYPSEGKGGLSVSFALTGASFSVYSNNDSEYDIGDPVYSVSAVVKKGIELDNAEQVGSKETLDLDLLPDYDAYGYVQSNEMRFGEFSGYQSFTGDFKATIEKTNLDTGYYWVTFSVDIGSIEGIVTKSVLVFVTKGKTTTDKIGTDVTAACSESAVSAYESHITYSITLDFNDNDEGVSYDYLPSSYCIRDTTPTILPTLTRDGYTFDGWYETDATGTYVIDYDVTEVTGSGDRYFQAQWTSN